MSAAEKPHHPLFIGGQGILSHRGERIPLRNPATGEILATVESGDKEDARQAIEVAQKAFQESDWPGGDGSQRSRILYRLSQLFFQRIDEFARWETMNQGKPLREARGDMLFAARTIEYMAGLADKMEGAQIPVSGERLDYTLREPVGVTVHIAPWNYPLQLAVRSLAPALAAGNSCILKPASLTPLTALEFAKMAKEAGVPDGILNVVVGAGRDVGEALVRDPRVSAVSFTGSLEVGRRIMELAASHVAPVTLELGGKSPHIVFPDADLDRAAKAVVFGIFQNAGQMCWAGSRLLVHRSIKEAFLEKVVQLARARRLGPGWEPGVEMGPLVSPEQLQRVREYIEGAQREGARLLTGGGRPNGPELQKGNFLEPTVFDGVSPDMTIAREEVFGPVLACMEFESFEEAVQKANDTIYGLYAGVWTRDLSTAHRAARALQAGMVSINEYPVTFPQTPFGGYKQSGLGSEQGRRAWEFYTRTKNVSVLWGGGSRSSPRTG
jgi:aldehyde dehydrogenase (NAD+)